MLVGEQSDTVQRGLPPDMKSAMDWFCGGRRVLCAFFAALRKQVACLSCNVCLMHGSLGRESMRRRGMVSFVRCTD